jgi:hypothetical protein
MKPLRYPFLLKQQTFVLNTDQITNKFYKCCPKRTSKSPKMINFVDVQMHICSP